MKTALELLGYDSLAFFGRVNASISHELKNIMAIISETAGLLSDLSEMASPGSPIDPRMLKNTADSIMEEIQRGFTTIRQMNRFSHSVDSPVVTVDLMEILDLVCHLSGYLSFTGKIDLNPWVGETPKVQTCPFLLQAVVYQTLVESFKQGGANSALKISLQPEADTGWVIVFAGSAAGEHGGFPDNQTQKAALSIGVTIHLEQAGGQLKLHVPQTIQDGAQDGSAEVMKADDTPSIPMAST